MSKKKTKKAYSVAIPPDFHLNPVTSSWFAGPLMPNKSFEPLGNVFDIDMPIHPEYIQALQPKISVGDLVETHNGKVGIVVSEQKPEGIFITIKNANNMYYKVLINDKEEKYIGYSLKKIDKNT